MGNQADVRVRLSAEGQAEVVAAFQKIAGEGKKAGAEAAVSFKALNDQLKDVAKTLTGGIGIVLVADKFAEFFKSTIEGSENLTRLSRQTGLSTDLIQGFGRAARETGVNQEVANNALAKFTVNVGKAGVGSKASRDALSDLGISIKDFSKLAPDQQFAQVAQRLAAIADPARRARDEVALFSRAGVQLDQALIKVGAEGLDPFIAHMKELGVFLDAESINSIRNAAETFKDLGDTVKGLATQFLTGLVPGLQAATDELLRATSGPGVSGFKKVGEILGDVFRTVINYLEHTANGLAAWAAKAGVEFELLATQVKHLFNKQVLSQALRDADAQFKAIDEARAERNKEADDRLARAPEKPAAAVDTGAGRGGEGAEGAQASALAKARLSLLEARLNNELTLYKAHAALVKEADKAAYDAGTLSIAEYFQRRGTLINAELDKELAVLKAKRAAIASTAVDINDPVGEITHKQALAKLDNEIQVAELQRTAQLAANTNEAAAAQRKLYEDTLKSELKLLEIAGKKTEAARLKLSLDLADLDAQLRKSGTSDADRAAAESTVAGQGNAQIDFGAAAQKAQADLAALESARKAIENQVRDGEIFSIDAAQKIVLLDQQRLPALQADAAAMLKLAQATGNALDVEKAQAYKDKIDQIAASTNQLGLATAQLRQGLENAIGDGITKFLTDASKGTKTLKQDFTDAALSIVQDIEKIAIKLLETSALKALFGSSTGSGGSGAAGGLLSGLAGALAGGFASGGQVRGPGTSTSDSIPALLSDREYVVNARAATQPGVLPLLNALNQGSLRGVNGSTSVPKFAAGGSVGGASSAPVIKLVNVMDPTALGDHLATAAGERSVLNVISRNPQRVRSSLG